MASLSALGEKTTLNPFRIEFHLADVPTGVCRLNLTYVNTHYSVPPSVEVAVNDARPYTFQAPPGVTTEGFSNPRTGKSFAMPLLFPGRHLRKGRNTITITHKTGSWALYDALWLESGVPVPETPVISSIQAQGTMFYRRIDLGVPASGGATQSDGPALGNPRRRRDGFARGSRRGAVRGTGRRGAAPMGSHAGKSLARFRGFLHAFTRARPAVRDRSGGRLRLSWVPSSTCGSVSWQALWEGVDGSVALAEWESMRAIARTCPAGVTVSVVGPASMA